MRFVIFLRAELKLFIKVNAILGYINDRPWNQKLTKTYLPCEFLFVWIQWLAFLERQTLFVVRICTEIETKKIQKRHYKIKPNILLFY